MAGVDFLCGINVFLTDIGHELLPHGFHRIDPCGPLLGRQAAHGAAGVDDRLTGLLVHGLGCGVARDGDLVQDGRELIAHVRIQALPPILGRHHQIVDHAVVGFGDAVLHLEELLTVDV